MDGPIGVIYSPWVEEAAPMAEALAKELRGGFEPWVCSVLDLEEHEQKRPRMLHLRDRGRRRHHPAHRACSRRPLPSPSSA